VIFRIFSSAMAPPAENSAQKDFCRLGLFSRKHKKLPWLLFPLLLSIPVASPNVKQETGSKTGQTAKAAESPIKYSGIAYKSENRRDPFLNPAPNKKAAKQADEEISRGTPPPGIAGTFIEQASLEGISSSRDHRTALVRGSNNRAYLLKEGDRLFDGYLKTIHSDSITLIRETKMRSGKTLTQEVTKRLRTP
jgi:hypothetical protein